MWRHLSRGISHRRLNWNRPICSEKPDSQLKDKKTSHQSCCIKGLLPCALQKLNLTKCQDSRQQNREDSQQTGNVGHHSFLEAFGWSGAVVFGWIISKQIWLQHGWIQDKDSRSNKVTFDINFIPILSNFGHVKTQPPTSFILPQLSSSNTNKNSDISNFEDEFEKAAKDLQSVHERVVGQSLNRRGISYLSKPTASEAIKYFRQASELKYPPASFNMGQCCELGIGIKQDFKQAAEWYRIASDQGHPTATYNLGVFYAHGWGGLTADIKTAQQLFSKAAQLGQPDAIAALAKESKQKVEFRHNNNRSPVESIDSNEPKLSSHLFFSDSVKNERDNIFHRGYVSDKKWDVPLARSLPVAI